MAQAFTRRPWPRWARIAVVVAVVVVMVVAIMSSGGEEAPAPAAGPSAPTSTSTSTYAIGATARTGDFDVTVHAFTDPEAPGQFLHPSPGTHYVSVDVEVVNRSATPQTFSSLLAFSLIDGRDRRFDATFGEVTPPAPDGEIPAAGATRGLALFEVPDGATGLRLRVQGTPTAEEALFMLV